MKQLLLIAAIIFSVTVNAQVKKDTIPAQKIDTTYFIYGTKADFNVMLKAVLAPGQMTRDEIDMLYNWINNKAIVPKKKN